MTAHALRTVCEAFRESNNLSMAIATGGLNLGNWLESSITDSEMFLVGGLAIMPTGSADIAPPVGWGVIRNGFALVNGACVGGFESTYLFAAVDLPFGLRFVPDANCNLKVYQYAAGNDAFTYASGAGAFAYSIGWDWLGS